MKKLLYIFQGRIEDDVFDTYYKVNSVKSIHRVANVTGFEVKNIIMLNSGAQFVIFPPLLLFEFLWIRILMTKRFKSLRPYIVTIFKKS